jgi:hypothetical protein
MSQAKFEYFQLTKRIKYRIEEVSDWKMLSEMIEQKGLLKSGKDYKAMLMNSLELKWVSELKNPNLTDSDKKIIETKLKTLKNTVKIPAH